MANSGPSLIYNNCIIWRIHWSVPKDAFISDINISIGYHFYWDNERGRRVKSLPACCENSPIFHSADQFFKRSINSTLSLWEIFQSNNPFTHFLPYWALSLEHRLVLCSDNCLQGWIECPHLRWAGVFTAFYRNRSPKIYPLILGLSPIQLPVSFIIDWAVAYIVLEFIACFQKEHMPNVSLSVILLL